MKIRLILNGKKIEAEIKADTLLLDLVREKGLLQCKAWLRNYKLWTLHGMAGWKAGAFLLCSCGQSRRT